MAIRDGTIHSRHSTEQVQRWLRLRPWIISSIYAFIGMLWIFFSDRILAALFPDPGDLVVWSSYKGFAFVGVTAAVLALLLTWAFGSVGKAYASLAATEAALRNEKVFADTMIESMPGIVYFYDSTGHFLRWNRNFEVVSGYSSEAMAALHPRDFFRGEDVARVEECIAEVFERGETSLEAAFVTKRGEAIPFFFTGRRVMFDGAVCLAGMGIDISARVQADQQLAESERNYRELVEHANSVILRWDREGTILFLNEFGCKLFGYSVDEIVGQNVLGTIVPPVDSGGRDLERLIEEIGNSPVAHGRVINENVCRNGDRVWIDWTNRVERNDEGRVTEILSIGADISDRKRIEAERDRRQQAEAADRIKSAFLATMSHELRTPLNSIIGFTGILLQELAGPLNAEQRKQLQMAQGSARHLLALVNDVLDISKIEAGQLEIRREMFDVEQSIEKILAIMRPQAESQQLALRARLAKGLGELEGDQRRFEQVLLNLLSNAIKFTNQGEVVLKAELLSGNHTSESEHEGEMLRFQVSDTGVGIGPQDLASLFQPFRQLDSGSARSHEGTGLGLAICRRLVELMGGAIDAESQPGEGSTFVVTLPRSITEGS